ncbi:MAG TPA: M23 family metallopeptidase [Polyangia bacterium]|jgi:murein DD-endopeptidase MepM/ murein hydrolase activator NlpD
MPGERRRAAPVVLLMSAAVIFFAVAVAAAAEPPAGAVDTPESDSPPRLRDTLGIREMILVNQVGFARGTARWRARELYRLLQNPVREDGQRLAPSDRARAVVASLNALKRDRQEQAALVRELDEVRVQRSAAARAAPAAAAGQADPDAPATPSSSSSLPAPAFVVPVEGVVASPFGPARDAASGVWLFHPGLRWRGREGEAVRAPEAGVVQRVADADGGRAVVIRHAGNWISIVGGLRDVTASVGQSVTRGQVVGHAAGNPGEPDGVTLELWHRRAAVDPASVLRR